ncbi:hypothetical protein [Methylorubrum sp. SB2]|uniref:hypothetical protein n=1 Tax=Methylorubrum subtropicum TaxID=3138812 RepID=UPI00313F092C
MARPIRAHIAGAAQPPMSVLKTEAPAPEPVRPETDDVARLRMEVLMMKAALAAERRESEALRSSLGLGDVELGDEARAERDRWAALVGRLIHGKL